MLLIGTKAFDRKSRFEPSLQSELEPSYIGRCIVVNGLIYKYNRDDLPSREMASSSSSLPLPSQRIRQAQHSYNVRTGGTEVKDW